MATDSVTTSLDWGSSPGTYPYMDPRYTISTTSTDATWYYRNPDGSVSSNQTLEGLVESVRYEMQKQNRLLAALSHDIPVEDLIRLYKKYPKAMKSAIKSMNEADKLKK